MSVFDIIVKSFSLAASIATIVACVPLFIAYANYRKNLLKGNRLVISTKFLYPIGDILKIEINLQNKTNRLFYITNLYLLIGENKFTILKQIHLNIDTPHSPIKIEPYQFITIEGVCHIVNNCDFNVPSKLVVSVVNKNFCYDIKLLHNQLCHTNYCKNSNHRKRKYRNNHTDN